MAALKEVMFIDGLIADKIGTNNNTWALIMGNYLHVIEGGKEMNKYLVPQTYYSPIYFKNDGFICCHTVELNIATGTINNHDIIAFCKTGNHVTSLTENHVITHVAWSGNTALVSVNFFVPRNNLYEKKDAMNYLFALSGIGGQPNCILLRKHAYIPLNTAEASPGFWASFGDRLYIWQEGKQVEHGLQFDIALQMENIFFMADEKQMVLMNALGKVFVINTSSWQIIAEQQLQKSNSMLHITMSPNGNLIATGNNEGYCYLYSKNGEGYMQILCEKMDGIITALHINNNRLLIGLNGNKRRGLICYEIV